MGNIKQNLFLIGKGLLTAGSIGLKAISIAFLPITIIAGAIISPISIRIDGMKMIEIFEDAYTPLRFKTLLGYIEKIKEEINNLDSLGNTLKKKYEMENKKEE